MNFQDFRPIKTRQDVTALAILGSIDLINDKHLRTTKEENIEAKKTLEFGSKNQEYSDHQDPFSDIPAYYSDIKLSNPL